MGRYPWACLMNDYIRQQIQEGFWSDNTAFERKRLLIRIEQDLIKALAPPTNQINPRWLTIDNIRAYLTWLKNESGRSASTQRNALLLLNEFLIKSVGNTCVDRLKRQWPLDIPGNTPRPKFAVLAKGFDRIQNIPDEWQRIICRGQAAIFIGTLIRPSEGRLTLRGDLDDNTWVIRVRHPKGKTPERIAPFIEDRCKREMAQFMKERAFMLRSLNINDLDPKLPLFPVLENGTPPRFYTQQCFNRIWRKAFPDHVHYCCRRGMAQETLDRDSRLMTAISTQLGHSSTETTQRYYAKPSMERVRTELEKAWNLPSEMPIKPLPINDMAYV